MGNSLTVIRSFDHPVHHVFEAWISPRSVVAPVTAVTMDATVGGAITIATGEQGAGLQGRFVAVEPRQRLTYTWRWGAAAEETMVDVAFHDLETMTVVEVEHRGFLDEASLQTHLTGWVDYFDGLSALL